MVMELINWVEIPVNNMDRARKFYETVLQTQIVDVQIGDEVYPCFPNKDNNSYSGALVNYEFIQPGRNGSLIYFAAQPDVGTMLERVLNAGGNIIKERSEVAPGFGYYALFEDSEGNTMAIQGDE
jgi:uncharacterized protein